MAFHQRCRSVSWGRIIHLKSQSALEKLYGESQFIIVWCHNKAAHLWLVAEKAPFCQNGPLGGCDWLSPPGKQCGPLWRQSPACLLFVDWWESCSASCVSMEEAPWEGPETTMSPPNSLNLTAPVPTHLAITAQPRWAAVFAIKSWSLTSRCQSLKKSIIKCKGTDGWQFHLIHLSLALLCFFLFIYKKKISGGGLIFFPEL